MSQLPAAAARAAHGFSLLGASAPSHIRSSAAEHSQVPAELGMPLMEPGSWLQQVPYVLMWPLCAVAGPKTHTDWSWAGPRMYWKDRLLGSQLASRQSCVLMVL